ncbi:MAG: hypothetical protein EON88_24605 [Brevundimonas sp.]|nr:MAG: hypothetical protein EON88_24605 [Brevundimonas sp.]
MADGSIDRGADTAAGRPLGRCAPPDAAWQAAREEYLAGFSGPQVCRRHGLSLTALRRRARAEGWRRADQAWTAPSRLDSATDAWDEGAALEEAVGGNLDAIDFRELAWVANQRMMRAVLRGDAAGALRWRKVRDVMDAEQAVVDQETRLDEALAFTRAEAAERPLMLAEAAKARRAADAGRSDAEDAGHSGHAVHSGHSGHAGHSGDSGHDEDAGHAAHSGHSEHAGASGA